MPRLQFSIRALLLLMAVVGVSITVFRWPWTVTKRDTENIVTTQYRRGWNGKPLKNGLQITTSILTPETVTEELFSDGDLRRERALGSSGVNYEAYYRDGRCSGSERVLHFTPASIPPAVPATVRSLRWC